MTPFIALTFSLCSLINSVIESLNLYNSEGVENKKPVIARRPTADVMISIPFSLDPHVATLLRVTGVIRRTPKPVIARRPAADVAISSLFHVIARRSAAPKHVIMRRRSRRRDDLIHFSRHSEGATRLWESLKTLNNRLIQILPVCIKSINQFIFSTAAPRLQLFFSGDRYLHRSVNLKVY